MATVKTKKEATSLPARACYQYPFDKIAHLEDIKADVSKLIHVWMEAIGFKFHCRCLERVLRWKLQAQFVCQAFVNCASGPFDSPYPMQNVITLWESRDSRIT